MIPTGPILSRELLTAARRPQTYRQRCAPAALMLLILGWASAAAHFWHRGEFSIADLAELADFAFSSFLLLQIALTFWFVPTFVAGVIAGERERRTLGDLLTTRLTSAEIVLGKLAAGLVQYATCLATGLPVVSLLPLLGGVDPGLVLLAYAGTASTAFFLAGLSVLVSIGAPRGGQAIRQTCGLAAAWALVPLLVSVFLPRAFPRLWPWARPVNDWLLASTPTDVLLGNGGRGLGQTAFESVFWMIGLQVAAGLVMMAWAVLRLRAASRNQAGGDAGWLARHRVGLRWRLIRRPACGDSPVLWKELHTARPGGFAELVGRFAFLIIFASIGYGSFYFGWPAALEWWTPSLGSTPSEISRLKFNNYLRGITSLAELVALLVVAGAAAEGVAAERARGTWDSLLATPLDGREILRAKMVGAVWKARWGGLLLGVLWSAGLLAGSLHPLGVAAALTVLGVSTLFMAALGTYVSLIARDVVQAMTRATATVVLLTGTFLACLTPSRITSVVLGAGSVPFVNWLCLVSYRDIRETVGEGTFDYLTTMGIFTGEGPLCVLATCLIGTAGSAVAAAWLTVAALRRFDRLAGRPERAPAGDGCDSPGRRSRWVKRVAIALPMGLVLLAVGYHVLSPPDEQALRAALAETDRLSPGWRLADLEAARARVPDDRNAAFLVLAARDQIPPGWQGTEGEPSPAEQALQAAMEAHAPGTCLHTEAARSLRAARDAVGPVLADTRALADLPEGRYPVVWARDAISTPLPHLKIVRQVATVLSYDALVRAHDGDLAAALISCRALLNAGRSIGDEPLLISQSVRMLIRAQACRQIEFALAHGEAPDADLAVLQHHLEEEDAQPLLWSGLRGERACMNEFFALIGSGELTLKQLRDMGQGITGSVLVASTATNARAALLHYFAQAIAIAKLPPEDQEGALSRLEETVKDLSFAAKVFTPSLLRVAATFHRTKAQLRCAATALAAERFRRARGPWPAALEQLVPDFLAMVPTDPIDGKPLRIRRVADGVVIESLSRDSRDHGGGIARDRTQAEPDDRAFHLWDVPLRHRPVKPSQRTVGDEATGNR
jgi:ABC-type transport system involved in multi-copper enzyme maturation permease subunit